MDIHFLVGSSPTKLYKGKATMLTRVRDNKQTKSGEGTKLVNVSASRTVKAHVRQQRRPTTPRCTHHGHCSRNPYCSHPETSNRAYQPRGRPCSEGAGDRGKETAARPSAGRPSRPEGGGRDCYGC